MSPNDRHRHAVQKFVRLSVSRRLRPSLILATSIDQPASTNLSRIYSPTFHTRLTISFLPFQATTSTVFHFTPRSPSYISSTTDRWLVSYLNTNMKHPAYLDCWTIFLRHIGRGPHLARDRTDSLRSQEGQRTIYNTHIGFMVTHMYNTTSE